MTALSGVDRLPECIGNVLAADG
jgi:hypothetical protein